MSEGRVKQLYERYLKLKGFKEESMDIGLKKEIKTAFYSGFVSCVVLFDDLKNEPKTHMEKQLTDAGKEIAEFFKE